MSKATMLEVESVHKERAFSASEFLPLEENKTVIARQSNADIFCEL